jgi:hypothetical protein
MLMAGQSGVWLRRILESAALTIVVSGLAITSLWLWDEPPHLPGVLLPPTVIFLIALLTSSRREQAREERQKRRRGQHHASNRS